MSSPVIIRLQNLPLEARSIDIRKFFDGLLIPDGGVHIIGGERGDAFIAFKSDEDARLAMSRDGNYLCNSKIKLFLSSKNEMQNVISAARSQLQQQQQQQQPSSLLPTLTGSSSVLFNNSNTCKSSVLSGNTNTSGILSSITKLLTKQNDSKPEHLAPIQAQSSLQTPQFDIKAILDLINKPPLQQDSKQEQEPKQTAKKTLLPTPPLANTYNTNNNQSQAQSEPNKPTYKRKFEETNQSKNKQSTNNSSLSAPKVPLLGNAPPTNQSSSRQILEPIIRVKNFPHNCSYKDIRTFLQGIQIEHNGIKFIYEPPNSNSHKGQAFVRLMSITDLKKALCRNGQFYDDKQIQVLQSCEAEINTQNKPNTNSNNIINNINTNNNNNNNNTAAAAAVASVVPLNTGLLQKPIIPTVTNAEPIVQSLTSFFIKIYGLPALFDESSLKNMFNNVKFLKIYTSNPTPIQSKVTNSDGTSETKTILKAKKLCQVETQLDVERALTRQDERVGKNKIQIFQISKSEFEREVNSIKPHKFMNLKSDCDDDNESSNFDEEDELNEENTSANLDETEELNEEEQDRDDCEQDEEVENSLKKLKKPALLPTPKLLTDINNKRIRSSSNSPNSNSNSPNSSSNSSTQLFDLPPLPPELQKYKNSIVLLSNVSYEATREDILELFKIYSPIEQTLKIRHDDRGQPTGDAIVACKSHEDASKASRYLNGTLFMGKCIRATLINSR